MPHPHLAELAYRAFATYLDRALPAWPTLPLLERLAWGMAARAAVQEAHRLPCAMGIQVPSKRTKGATMRCLVGLLMLLSLVGVLQAQPMGVQPEQAGQAIPVRGMRGTVQALQEVAIQNPERLLIWVQGAWLGAPPDTCYLEPQGTVVVQGWDTEGVVVEYRPPPNAAPPTSGTCPRGTIVALSLVEFRAMAPIYGPQEALEEAQRVRIKRLLR
jgi:hypothetical protein